MYFTFTYVGWQGAGSRGGGGKTFQCNSKRVKQLQSKTDAAMTFARWDLGFVTANT